jgi:hypothetical protein
MGFELDLAWWPVAHIRAVGDLGDATPIEFFALVDRLLAHGESFTLVRTTADDARIVGDTSGRTKEFVSLFLDRRDALAGVCLGMASVVRESEMPLERAQAMAASKQRLLPFPLEVVTDVDAAVRWCRQLMETRATGTAPTRAPA